MLPLDKLMPGQWNEDSPRAAPYNLIVPLPGFAHLMWTHPGLYNELLLVHQLTYQVQR